MGAAERPASQLGAMKAESIDPQTGQASELGRMP
jgi:hypothetical protein